jgi:ABC-type oligopeptide transport system substrate-binding subunit
LVGWAPDWFGENNGRSVIAPLFDGRSFGQGTTNYGGYNSAVVNGLIDRATTAPSRVQAELSWREAARRLMDDAALVPLIEYKNAYAKSSRVRNCVWSVFGGNCDINALWLEGATQKAGGSR